MSRPIEDIARDVERSRLELDRTIDTLADRLSPGGLAEEALGFLRRNGHGAIVDDAVRSLARNPIPAILAVAAAGWFLSSWSEERRARRFSRPRRHPARPVAPMQAPLGEPATTRRYAAHTHTS